MDNIIRKTWHDITADVEHEARFGFGRGWPVKILEYEKLRYVALEIESRFNDEYGINQGYNERVKAQKHLIIAQAIEREMCHYV